MLIYFLEHVIVMYLFLVTFNAGDSGVCVWTHENGVADMLQPK